MILFRILCALLLAWAFNLALAREEAEPVLQILAAAKMPDLAIIGPIAGALVGFLNLAVRQGWGMIVGFANGIWAGVLSIVFAGFLTYVVKIVRMIRELEIQNFDEFLVASNRTYPPIFDAMADVRFLVITMGMMSVVGVLTELVHWLMVRVRGQKGGDSDTPYV